MFHPYNDRLESECARSCGSQGEPRTTRSVPSKVLHRCIRLKVFRLVLIGCLLAAVTPDRVHGETARPMPYRFLFTSLGWITSQGEEGGGYYPGEISDQLAEDWDDYAEYMKEVGFKAIGPWGFYCNTFPYPLAVGKPSVGSETIRITKKNQQQARRIVESCQKRGIDFYYGHCLYFVYWQDYLKAVPEAAPEDPQRLCPLFTGDPARQIPGSTELMKQSIDFILEVAPVSGITMESFHHGRCKCERCLARFPDTSRGTAEFHWYANEPIFKHIRQNYPEIKIMFCAEGPLEVIQRTENLDILIKTLKAVDYYIWCSAIHPPEVMRKLAEAAPNTGLMMRQEPWQSVPPWRSPRDGWFFPNLVNPLGRTIHERSEIIPWAGVAGCGLGRHNPGDNVNLRFLARMQMDPSREPEAVAKSVLRDIFKPQDDATLDTLYSVFSEPELAFRKLWPTWFMHVDFMPTNFKFTPLQTMQMIGSYQISLVRLRSILEKLDNREEAARLENSIVSWIEYIRKRLLDDYKYPMPEAGSAKRENVVRANNDGSVIRPQSNQDGAISLHSSSVDTISPAGQYGACQGKPQVFVGIHSFPPKFAPDSFEQAVLRIPQTDYMWTTDTSVDQLAFDVHHIDAADDQKVTLPDGTSSSLAKIGTYRKAGPPRMSAARFREFDVTQHVRADLKAGRASFAWRIEPVSVSDEICSSRYFPTVENTDNAFPPKNRGARLILRRSMAAAPRSQAVTLQAQGPALVLPVQRRIQDSAADERIVEETWRVPLSKVAFVTQHLWNNGDPDGPPHPGHLNIGMGSLENCERARKINQQYILPVLESARKADLTVAHSQPGFIAPRYPQHQALVARMTGKPAEPPWPEVVIPDYTAEEMAAWTTNTWPGWGQMDFPSILKPLPSESVSMTGEGLDHVLKQRGITHIVYVGYATDMCLIGYAGGLNDMVHRFGYKACVLREGTLATENPEGPSGPEKTVESLKTIERDYGWTASVADFKSQLQRFVRSETTPDEVRLAAFQSVKDERVDRSRFVLPIQRQVADTDGHEKRVTEQLDLPRSEVALITMHLWNFGEIGGPPVPENICVADGTLRNALRARRIDWVYVRPTLMAARKAGLPIIHAQPGFIAPKYPQHQALVAEISGAPAQSVMVVPEMKEYTEEEMAKWTADNWPGRNHLDFPPLLKPLPDEPVVKTKKELDYLLKKRGIKTLIYIGYATNCCVIDYHCGLKDMVGKLGYQACVLREATLATECPGADGVKQTAEALELIEREFGATASVHDFRDALLPPRHNTFSSHVGWITSEANQPSYYPNEIPDHLVRDWEAYFPYMREIGFRDVGIFMFLTYNLPVPLGVDTKGIGIHANDVRITSDKINKCRRIIRSARAHGVHLYYGLGLYSWNVGDLKDAYPEAAPNKRVLCGMYPGNPQKKIPSCQQMMKDAVDFAVEQLPELEGWWLTSGDHGRCTCDDCNKRFPAGLRGNMEYFLATDLPIMRYIREKYPHMTIAYCTEVLNEGIEDPSNFDILEQMAGACDIYLWGNLQKDPDATVKRLAAACPNTKILFYQRPWQSTPPLELDRDAWFMPNFINKLGRDMHRRANVVPWTGVLACALAKENPSDELSMRFMARMMDEADREPEIVFEELLQAWYVPKTQKALDELFLVFTEVEDAFRKKWPTWFMHIDMVPKGLGALAPEREWTPEQAVVYVNTVETSLARLRSVQPELQNHDEAARLETSIEKWLRYLRRRMRDDHGHAMP